MMSNCYISSYHLVARSLPSWNYGNEDYFYLDSWLLLYIIIIGFKFIIKFICEADRRTCLVQWWSKEFQYCRTCLLRLVSKRRERTLGSFQIYERVRYILISGCFYINAPFQIIKKFARLLQDIFSTVRGGNTVSQLCQKSNNPSFKSFKTVNGNDFEKGNIFIAFFCE